MASVKQKIWDAISSSSEEGAAATGLLPYNLKDIYISWRKYLTTSIFLNAIAAKRGFQFAMATFYVLDIANSSVEPFRRITLDPSLWYWIKPWTIGKLPDLTKLIIALALCFESSAAEISFIGFPEAFDGELNFPAFPPSEEAWSFALGAFLTLG